MTVTLRKLHSVSVEVLPTRPEELDKNVGLNQSMFTHETELRVSAFGLMQYCGLSRDVAERVAFEIVGQDIPEVATREALHAKYAQTELELGQTTMRMLDGNLRPPTAYGRDGVANPEPTLPLEYWLEERYNTD